MRSWFQMRGVWCLVVVAACGRSTFSVSVTDSAVDGTATGDVAVPDAILDAALPSIHQRAYLKASNTGAYDRFSTVAVSADGATMVVGAASEASAARGIDGDQSDNSAMAAGAAYVFVRSGEAWVQQVYLKASNTDAGDEFGNALALSSDGSTLAVGAWWEGSAASGIDGDQSDNSLFQVGAVYVFTRVGSMWTQQAYLKASNPGQFDYFGFSVALSADGSTLAVGSTGEDSDATGINGDQTDESAMNAGAAYVFERTGSTWAQTAYVKASNTDAGDMFSMVALSGDGATLAVTGMREASTATGVDGDQTDNSLYLAGAVYVFVRSGSGWAQQAYLKAPYYGGSPLQFGVPLALSTDGSTLAAASYFDRSGATGINGDPTDTSAPNSGAVHVFTRTNATWSEQAFLKASNASTNDYFGSGLALSGDGTRLAVGAVGEDSAARGIDGDQADNSAPEAGAVYVYDRTLSTWAQRAYLKASNTDAQDQLGPSVALSADGSSLAVGAPFESSAATAVDGDQTDNSAPSAGAVYDFALP